MKYTLFAAFSLLFIAPLAAQTCYEIALKKGQAAYDKGNYLQAREYWQAGKDCPGASAAKLNTLIAKTRDSDGDGVVNGRDNCPSISGLKHFKGCPQPTSTLTPSTTFTNMVLVRGGIFIMGDLFDEGSENEKPLHLVTVGDFYLGRTEVTFEEFDVFCTVTRREKPHDWGWGRGKHPVIEVDWYDAVEYCNWLSQQQKLTPAYTVDKSRQDLMNSNTYDKKKWTVTYNASANGYRLPTEAEWEYAAREGGKKVRFGNGKDQADPAYFNFNASASYKNTYSVVGEYHVRTVEVGSFHSPNSLGLHDMSGNVWEWCWDWKDTYLSVDQTNPVGAAWGSTRALRGGGWLYPSESCRVSSRFNEIEPTIRRYFIGFRVAASFR